MLIVECSPRFFLAFPPARTSPGMTSQAGIKLLKDLKASAFLPPYDVRDADWRGTCCPPRTAWTRWHNSYCSLQY
jgi:hypothetical protein